MNKLKAPFTLLLILITMSVSYGQFGVRAGANLASLNVKAELFGVSISESTDNKIGFQLGAFYKKALNDKFSIRPNLLLTTGGGKAMDEFTEETNSISTTYLALPIDFMYHMPTGENTLSLVAGPYAGYLLSSSSSDEANESEFASMDFGLNFGLQFQINSLGIGINYGLGIANVIPEEASSDPFLEDFSAKANSRVVSLYFTYDL